MSDIILQTADSRQHAIDLWKFLMAICVVSIHTHPLEKCKYEIVLSIYNTFCTLAVPFFFLASGYFLSFKLDNSFRKQDNIRYVKKYLCRIVKLYFFGTIVYLPMAMWGFRQSGIRWNDAISLWVKKVVLVGENYNSWPLWYLLSTIYGLILIMWLLRKKLDLKKMFLCAVIILVLSGGITYLVDYEENLPFILDIIKRKIANSIMNGRILLGAFYIPIGIILGKRKINKRFAVFLFICTFVLNNFFTNSFVKLLLTACSSIGLFSVIAQTRLSDSKVYFYLRKASKVLYFTHMYVWTFYYMMVYGEKRYGLDCFMMTLMGTILIAIIYVGIQKKIKKG